MKTWILPLLLISSLAQADVKRATYSAAGAGIVPPATPTDICKISGSATKTVYVSRVEISSTQTTAGMNTFYLVKRSADNVGGTAATMTAIPYDAYSAASGASVRSYTANPTVGTAIGNIKALHLLSPAPAGTAAQNPGVWDFDRDGSGQPIVLHGVAQVLAVNFAGASLPTGLSVNCNFTWQEE